MYIRLREMYKIYANAFEKFCYCKIDKRERLSLIRRPSSPREYNFSRTTNATRYLTVRAYESPASSLQEGYSVIVSIVLAQSSKAMRSNIARKTWYFRRSKSNFHLSVSQRAERRFDFRRVGRPCGHLGIGNGGRDAFAGRLCSGVCGP